MVRSLARVTAILRNWKSHQHWPLPKTWLNGLSDFLLGLNQHGIRLVDHRQLSTNFWSCRSTKNCLGRRSLLFQITRWEDHSKYECQSSWLRWGGPNRSYSQLNSNKLRVATKFLGAKLLRLDRQFPILSPDLHFLFQYCFLRCLFWSCDCLANHTHLL